MEQVCSYANNVASFFTTKIILDYSVQKCYILFMGRHKEFDRQEALYSAMKVFWEKGFEATSLPDLTKAMKISRSSLYETFKDKESLFEEAMNNYSQEIGKDSLPMLMKSTSIKEGLKEFYRDMLDTCLNPDYPGGCFMVNTVVSLSSSDSKLAKRINENIGLMQQQLMRLIKKGQENGEISKNKDASSLVGLLMSTMIGIKVVSRIKKDRLFLEQMVQGALNALG